MKKLYFTFLMAAAITGVGAVVDHEAAALAILQSSAAATEKEAALERLKQIGTARSVAVLNSLLADESLSQWALDTLQAMPAPEAGKALVSALSATTAETKAGVVDALGRRREKRAVPDLIKLLSGSDSMTAVSAARALGKIGGQEAANALRKARVGASPELRVAVTDALFNCAEQSLAGGDAPTASEIYREFRGSNEPAQVRAAAFRGAVLSSKQNQAELLVAALKADDGAEQAALLLVRELPDRKATAAFAEALKEVGPTLQVALIEALNQRDDPVAAAAVAAAVGSNETPVRLAALKALGALGDANYVGLLARRAATGPSAERAEARSALTSLHRGDVSGAILAEIQNASLAVKIELVQTLARRAERGAVPELLRLAARGNGELSVAAIQALAELADDADAQALLALVVNAKNESDRDAAVSACVTVASRSKTRSLFSNLALNVAVNAPVQTRCALLDAAGQIGGSNVLAALRAALEDREPEIRRAALTVMAANAGDEARPDLLRLSREAATDDLKAAALRGYWRLVEGMNAHEATGRFAAVRDGLAVGRSPADLKLGLARLAELNSVEALELAQQYRREPAVVAEAESACLQIVARFGAAHVAVAEAVLRQLAGEAETASVRSEAQAFVAKLAAQGGYISPWLVSGPYRQEGKEAQQLFEVAFAPELPAASKVEWRPLPSAPGLTNWWFADLDQITGGNHCVVYLKARVFCPEEQPVSLAIGSDDGVKVWINGALVHANNTVRGFTPGVDKAKAALRNGWNDFLVKITQHTLGCAAAICVRNADGTAIAGLRVDSTE